MLLMGVERTVRLSQSSFGGCVSNRVAVGATGTRNAILAEPATTAVHDNVGIDVPIIYR